MSLVGVGGWDVSPLALYFSSFSVSLGKSKGEVGGGGGGKRTQTSVGN